MVKLGSLKCLKLEAGRPPPRGWRGYLAVASSFNEWTKAALPKNQRVKYTCAALDTDSMKSKFFLDTAAPRGLVLLFLCTCAGGLRAAQPARESIPAETLMPYNGPSVH